MLPISKHISIILLLAIYSPIIITGDKSSDTSLPVFVSLGWDCEPALSLRNLELRTEAYPFDWNNTPQFSQICNMIKNKFKDFLNPLFLKHNGASIKHTQYEIEFRHDFPSLTPHGTTGIVDFDSSLQPYYGGFIVDNFLDFLPIIAEKYTRRINRFLELLSSTKKIVFIRTHLTPEDAKQFVTLMETYYPNLNYQLIGLQSNNDIILKWEQIPSVKIYHTQTKHTHNGGWIQPQEWLEIMTQYGLNKKVILYSRHTL